MDQKLLDQILDILTNAHGMTLYDMVLETLWSCDTRHGHHCASILNQMPDLFSLLSGHSPQQLEVAITMTAAATYQTPPLPSVPAHHSLASHVWLALIKLAFLSMYLDIVLVGLLFHSENQTRPSHKDFRICATEPNMHLLPQYILAVAIGNYPNFASSNQTCTTHKIMSWTYFP